VQLEKKLIKFLLIIFNSIRKNTVIKDYSRTPANSKKEKKYIQGVNETLILQGKEFIKSKTLLT
jgi:hypothetical protein